MALTDVANVVFEDSPASISRTDGAYEITISADYTGDNVQQQINSEVITPNLSGTISIGQSSRDRMMKSEFSSLYRAIAIAVFLVFVVMAAQFESVKFSIMVMTTIPFSLVGSFGLLKLTGVSISMTSLLGFLILVGTVVNNGILYVDTVKPVSLHDGSADSAHRGRCDPYPTDSDDKYDNHPRDDPMALAIGSSGSTTQGLAIVDIGGLSAGVIVALFMVPVYYALLSRKPKEEIPDID